MPDTSRQQFQDELSQLEHQALGGLDFVCQALDRAVERLADHVEPAERLALELLELVLELLS